MHEQNVTFTVVPFNYNLAENPDKVVYHGVFVSNGPGDPVMCTPTIESLKWLMKQAEGGKKPVPIFGICLGNQLLALAAGAKVRRFFPGGGAGGYAYVVGNVYGGDVPRRVEGQPRLFGGAGAGGGRPRDVHAYH